VPGHNRIRCRRAVDIERKVGTEMMIMEDILKQFSVAIAEPDGVVCDVWKRAGRTEVEYEKPHGVAGSFQLELWHNGNASDHAGIKKSWVRIRDNKVGIELVA
jgi:hypothetical protein